MDEACGQQGAPEVAGSCRASRSTQGYEATTAAGIDLQLRLDDLRESLRGPLSP